MTFPDRVDRRVDSFAKLWPVRLGHCTETGRKEKWQASPSRGRRSTRIVLIGRYMAWAGPSDLISGSGSRFGIYCLFYDLSCLSSKVSIAILQIFAHYPCLRTHVRSFVWKFLRIFFQFLQAGLGIIYWRVCKQSSGLIPMMGDCLELMFVLQC